MKIIIQIKSSWSVIWRACDCKTFFFTCVQHTTRFPAVKPTDLIRLNGIFLIHDWDFQDYCAKDIRVTFYNDVPYKISIIVPSFMFLFIEIDLYLLMLTF